MLVVLQEIGWKNHL